MVERFKVAEADKFLKNNGIDIYGESILEELYSQRGESDFSNIWFENLRARVVKVDQGVVTMVSGRYCVRRADNGIRDRKEIIFEGDEVRGLVANCYGPYKLRYGRTKTG